MNIETIKNLLNCLQGRKTYIACAAIIALALCQKYLGVQIPQEIWLALFGLVIIALRSAIGSAASLIALIALPSILLIGCVADRLTTPDGAKVERIAFLWPTAFDAVDFTIGTNTVHIGKYNSDGGAAAASSITAAAVSAAVKSAVK